MLLLLVSGQSIHLLDLQHMKMEDLCSFHVLQHTKTSRPGAPHTQIKIAWYSPDPTISQYSCLKEYIHCTQILRGTETMLFISYVKPYKPVSRDTISRWTTATLKTCGIDTTTFSAHITRAAYTCKVCAKAVPIHKIMAKAGWRSAQTIYRHCFKPVLEEDSVTSGLLSNNA